jgi:hypothetical protein
VWSKDQLTGEVSLKPVTNVFVHQVNSLLNLWVKGQKLTTTKNHIFYVAGKGWIEAGRILSKDKVMMKDGSLEEVTGTEEVALTEAVNVYNFEVADWHTYFVGQGVLVHNQSIESCEAVGKLFVEGKAFKVGEVIPDNALVVRGGESKIIDLKKNQEKDFKNHTLSANSGIGVDEADLSVNLLNNKITTCKAGDLRAKGYDVAPSPTIDNPFHVSIITPGGKLLTDDEASVLQNIFSVTPNPLKTRY